MLGEEKLRNTAGDRVQRLTLRPSRGAKPLQYLITSSFNKSEPKRTDKALPPSEAKYAAAGENSTFNDLALQF